MTLDELQATVGEASLAVTSPADHVAVVTIDRPDKANTIDDEMHYALTGIWQRIERRGDIRAIVLTGRGRVFCGGGDRSHWPSLIEDRHYRRNKMTEARAIVVNMLRCELPIVAAVNGPAVGLGCTLALAADLIVMGDDAHLADPHVAHGIVAGDGGAALLPYLIPPAQARSILFTGRRVTADEARQLGLATEVVPADAVADRSVALASQLAACSPDAIRDTKRAINLGLLQQALPALEMASAAEASSFDTDHYRRGAVHAGGGKTTAMGDGLDDVAELRLGRWARAQPDAVAIVDGDRSLTYAEVDRLVDGLAGTLTAAGVGLGDVVTVWTPAWWQASVAFLAANRVGAIAHPMSDVLGTAEAAAILERVQPRAVVCGTDDPAGEDRVAAVAAAATTGSAGGSALVVPARSLPELVDRPASAASAASAAGAAGAAGLSPDPERPSALIFTSGTTSAPKSVLHTHGSLARTVRDVGERIGTRTGDVIGLASPIGHVRWVMFGAVLPFLVGGTLFTSARWRPAEWTARADEVGCRFAAFSPKHLEDLVVEAEQGRRCRTLEVVTCGGSFLSTPQLRRCEAALGVAVLRSYGCTEFPSAVGGGVDDPPGQRSAYDGRPLAGVEVRLEEGDDDEVVRLGGQGRMGRICLRGTHAGVGVTDPDGWYRTEDFGELVDGWLRVLGRKADIIIRNGENISANEVEGVLSGYAGLGEFAVVGRQDPVAGERVCLVVVGDPGTVPDVHDLAGFLGGCGVMKQKWPESVVAVDELPRTPNGKLVRRRLWELVNDGAPQD